MALLQCLISLLMLVCFAKGGPPPVPDVSPPGPPQDHDNTEEIITATTMFRIRSPVYTSSPKKRPWLPPPRRSSPKRPPPPKLIIVPCPPKKSPPHHHLLHRPPPPRHRSPPPRPRPRPPPRPPSPRPPRPPSPRPPRPPHPFPQPLLLPTHDLELQIVCPEVIDANMTFKDPMCNSPVATLAKGQDAETLVKKFNINSGDVARVTLKPIPSSRRRALQEGTPEYNLTTVIKDGPDMMKEIYAGTPIELTTIVFTLDFSDCVPPTGGYYFGWFPISPNRLPNAIFSNSTLPNNLQNYYRTCTYNKARVSSNNVFIIDTAINITCRGVLHLNNSDLRFDSSTSCGTAEQQSWEAQAEDQTLVLAQGNPALMEALKRTPRRRHIYILPPSVPCLWAGFADVTCTSYICYSFVKAQGNTDLKATDLHVIMHESMHNFGLEHASTLQDVYGDPTDVMGNFFNRQGLLCPSAPQLYRIGMATPLKATTYIDKNGTYGMLTSSNFTYGAVTLTIPAASVRDDNMVVVNLNRINATDDYNQTTVPIFYISYRVASRDPRGFDSALTYPQNGSVLIHKYNGIQSETASIGVRPVFLSNITVNQMWNSDPTVEYTDGLYRNGRNGFLVVRVLSSNATHATVSICQGIRKAEDDCDGYQSARDDDCNGYTDRCDPVCVDPDKRKPGWKCPPYPPTWPTTLVFPDPSTEPRFSPDCCGTKDTHSQVTTEDLCPCPN